MKDIANTIMEMNPSAALVGKFNTAMPQLSQKNSTIKEMMVAGQVLQAIKGNVGAFLALQKLMGDEVSQMQQTTQETQKVDFDTFCKNAGYPQAYDKQKEFIDFAFSGGVRMVKAARGYGKTDYVGIVGAAYRIYQDTKKTFVVINKDKSKAASVVSEIGRCLKENGIALDADNKNYVRVKGLTGKQDSAKAMSVKMSPKQNHPDFIICDDIVDLKDKYSKAERKYIRDFYEALTGLTSNIIFLGQPVFYKDLYSEIEPLIKVMSLPHGYIPELDHDLKARKAAGVSQEFIDANYHLKVAAGSSVPFAGIEEVNFFPSQEAFMWIDPSDGLGDYTAVCVMTSNFQNLIVAGFCFDKAWYECEEEIKQIWAFYKASRGGFETNKHGNHPVILLRQQGLDFAGRATTENKQAKIQNAATHKTNIKLSTYVAQDDEILSEANKLFNKTVKEYEYSGSGIKDDAPDAIASAMLYLGIMEMGKK